MTEGHRAPAWFETLYREADGAPERVPWALLAPHPSLLAWLEQPGLDVAGSDVLVVGCGLGDDAVELARRGCTVTAFDVSPSAVRWARQRHPDADVRFLTADLLALPEEFAGAFGLVVEVRTVQSLPEQLRTPAIEAIAATVAEGGVLLHIGLLATDPRTAAEWEGPPFPLSPEELAVYEHAGLQRLDLAHPREESPVMEVVLTMQRGGS